MSKEIIEIDVRITNDVAYKEDSGWGLYNALPIDYDDYDRVTFNKYSAMTVVGIWHRLDVGGLYKMRAEVIESPSHGIQYKIIKMHQDIPITPEQQKEYIRSFVTPLQLESIYKIYEGQDVIQMFKDNTFDYNKVYGFGEHTYNIVKERLLKNLELQSLVNEFPQLDFKILQKLMNLYNTDAQLISQKLKENPYILTNVSGIGFKTADDIATEMGFDRESPFRINSAIEYCLKENENNGDTWMKQSRLISKSFELLGLNKSKIKKQLAELDTIITVDGRVALITTFQIESELAKMLIEMNRNCIELKIDMDDFILRMEDKYKIKLTDQQKGFFHNFKIGSVTLLIGFAGTGKSMLQKLLIHLMEELRMSYALLAPTGQAGKVLARYTKRDASTIHRRIGIGKGKEEQEMMYTLEEDVIIIDESSMCDVRLMHQLVSQIKNKNARVLLLGDPFQIPSVGAGCVLRDLIDSGVCLVTELNQVFRQKEGGILDIVTKVRLGEKFIEDDFIGVKKFGNNCILVACPQHKMTKGYVHYYNDLVSQYNKDNVLVLSPTKKGELGTHAINRNLQSISNPKQYDDQPEIYQIKDKQEMTFRIGDNVMNTVNSYKMKNVDDVDVDVMNGESGFIRDLDQKNRSMVIQYDDDAVLTSSAYIENILHSYCITDHKSQGSAAKSVLAIIDKSHTFQLNANLIYVALSRAEEFLVILCNPRTLNESMKKLENLRRNTFLCELLKEYVEVIPEPTEIILDK